MGTVEAVAEAKAEILELAGAGRHRRRAVRRAAAGALPVALAAAQIVTFGDGDGADVRLAEFGAAARAEIVRSSVEPWWCR